MLKPGKASLCLLVLLSASLAAAQETPQVPQPQDRSAAAPGQDQATTALAKPDYSKEAFVTEKLYERYRFENDGTGRKEAIFRVHVLSETALQAFGQLRLGYNSANEKLEIEYVKVTKADGTVVTAGPEAIQDLSGPVQQIAPVYTDYREKHVTVPGFRPNDTLECKTITTFHTPMTPGQFWIQHDFNQLGVVLDERLEVDVPAGRMIRLKAKPGLDPKITEENGRRIYHWTSSHLTPSEEPRDDKKKKKKKKADDVPDVQLTTFTSWEEVGRWYAGLEKDRRAPSPEIRAKAQELTKGLTSDLDKTQALYDFVAQNFRYVSLSLGLGRYQPQAAADALRNQYGDCKDKNTLLAALLEAQGLHSSSVLMNSFRKIDPDVPSPSQFNHVITLVPIGKEEVWLDTTTEVAPFRLLGYSLRKKQALVIPPGGTPHLEETPTDPFVPDRELTEVEGKVDDSGRLDATVTLTVRGDMELYERMVIRRLAAAQWQQYAEGLNKSLGGDVTNVKVGNPAATREPFTISYHVSKANFIDWSKKKLQLKLPLSYIGIVNVSDDVDDTADAADAGKPEPFKIGATHEHTYKLKLELAPRFHATAPVAISLDRDYATYHSGYKVEGSTLSAERMLAVRLTELLPDRANDYRAFRRSVLADDGQSVTIESTAAETRSAPSDMKAADLIHSGSEARKNGNYGLAIELLNRAVEAEPKNKSAWNDLGLAYLDDRQDNLAINAFQKQIEIDPFDQYAFNNLGRVYLRQRKYDNADKWFNKQIEIQPLDKYAHENLGISLLEQHRYADAVPELERAASITPDNASPEVNLGRAYLNLGQDDKALAAFDKALSIAATPPTWNSVAYQLALKKTHLDRARSYAESAVSATAARLRNISLDQVQRRDLNETSSLSAYWDTLGWVAFAEGKIDLSESYVRAAWQLGGHSDGADHLGQIYEARGKKEEAAHFYALALNARRPEPEIRDHLAAVIGNDKVDSLVDKCRNEQQLSRTMQLSNPAALAGKADFFILLGPTATGPAVEGVSFAAGEEKLKPLAETIRAAKFSQTFPDETPLKLIRRGTATCTSGGGCVLVLALPEDVRSVD